jgi:hypothetical protein
LSDNAFPRRVLTGQLLYESMPTLHWHDWLALSEQAHDLFDAAAAQLRQQLSLCAECGTQAPFVEPLFICIDCFKRGGEATDLVLAFNLAEPEKSILIKEDA